MENSMNLSQEKTLAVFENATVTTGNQSMLESSGGLNNWQLGQCDFWPYYETYHHYWPLPQTITVTPNKTETAFKVVKVLLDKKLAKIQTVRQFIELMDAVVSVL